MQRATCLLRVLEHGLGCLEHRCHPLGVRQRGRSRRSSGEGGHDLVRRGPVAEQEGADGTELAPSLLAVPQAEREGFLELGGGVGLPLVLGDQLLCEPLGQEKEA